MKRRKICREKGLLCKRFIKKSLTLRISKIKALPCCLAALIPAVDGSAQDLTELLIHKIDRVVVTASRVETPVNQTAKLVTLITKEQIEEAPVQSIEDLLIYCANIDVLQRGGHGVQADISIRGGSKDQSAILINGVNFSNSHTGVYNLDIPVNLSDIERIEIIHGPSALIYGSSAFSGGINIITKKDADTKGYARIEGGMHDLRGMEVRGAAKVGIAAITLSAGYDSSEGYMDNTDYDLYNILLQTRLRFSENSKLDVNLGYNDKKYGANSFYTAVYPNQFDHTTRYIGSLKGEFGSKLKFVPILYWFRHHDVFELTRGSEQGKNYHRGDTYGTNLILNYTSAWGNTSLGAEFRHEDIMSSVLGKTMKEPHRKYKKYDDRLNTSVTLEHTVVLDHFVVSAGALMNHSTMESGKYKFYPSASAAYRPNDEWDIYTTWGSSSRLPSFTELYYTTETHDGNENLSSERSQSLDIGFKYRKSAFSAYLTGFMMWGRNIIDWVKVEKEDGRLVNASWNHTELNTKGIEAGVRFRLSDMFPRLGKEAYVSLDYARMHKDRDAKGENSIYQLNYLRDKFTAVLSHRIYGGFSAGWYFRYQKRMGSYEAYENTVAVGRVPYNAFSTLDLRLNYKYENLLLHVNLNNLYDTKYNDIANIPQAGFWLTAGVSYTLK